MSKSQKVSSLISSGNQTSSEAFFISLDEKQQVRINERELNLHVYPYFRFDIKKNKKMEKSFSRMKQNMLSYEGKHLVSENANSH
jgi:hypothetical protein